MKPFKTDFNHSHYRFARSIEGFHPEADKTCLGDYIVVVVAAGIIATILCILVMDALS